MNETGNLFEAAGLPHYTVLLHGQQSPGRHCRVSYSMLPTAQRDALEAIVLVTPRRGALGMA